MVLHFGFFVIVFTIGKVFAVWTGSKSFWNYIRASQKSDYLSIVLFVGLVMEVVSIFFISEIF